MQKYIVIGFSVLAVVILVLTFTPVQGEVDTVYNNYIQTRQYANDRELDQAIREERLKVETELKDIGLLKLNFPLKVANSDVYVAVTSETGRRVIGYGSSEHGGVDMDAVGQSEDIVIVSASSGVVKTVGYLAGTATMARAGNYIVIETNLPSGAPLLFKYFHMKDKPTLKQGDLVKSGDAIGVVGNSGSPKTGKMGAHLHYEIALGAFDIDLAESYQIGKSKKILHPFSQMYFSYLSESMPGGGFRALGGEDYVLNNH